MNFKYLWCALAALGALIAVLLAGFVWLRHTPTTSDTPSAPPSAELDSSSLEITQYTLRSYDGHLALFGSGDYAPLAEYDIYPTLLPEADRTALAQGICVPDEATLHRLLEDYGY